MSQTAPATKKIRPSCQPPALPAREFEQAAKILDAKAQAKIRVRDLIIATLQRIQNPANKNRNLDDVVAAAELEAEVKNSLDRIRRGKRQHELAE